jgi:hypothetical protein
MQKRAFFFVFSVSVVSIENARKEIVTSPQKGKNWTIIKQLFLENGYLYFSLTHREKNCRRGRLRPRQHNLKDVKSNVRLNKKFIFKLKNTKLSLLVQL